MTDGTWQAARRAAQPTQNVYFATKTPSRLAPGVRPPLTGCALPAKRGRAPASLIRHEDYEWSQAISSVVIAVERGQAPVSGYTLRLRQIHWNAFIHTCLPQGALSQNYFGATVENPFLSGTLTAAATDVARTSHDQVMHDMRARLHTHGSPSSTTPLTSHAAEQARMAGCT